MVVNQCVGVGVGMGVVVVNQCVGVGVGVVRCASVCFCLLCVCWRGAATDKHAIIIITG